MATEIRRLLDNFPSLNHALVIAGSLLGIALLVWWTTRVTKSSKGNIARESATPPVQSGDRKSRSNEPLPDPAPHPNFDINTTLTRDYIYANKPLRFPYFQTMAHQKMHIDNWIELDKDYMFYLDMKKRVIEQQGKVVMDSLPENDEACGELLEILVDYLPKVFSDSQGRLRVYDF